MHQLENSDVDIVIPVDGIRSAVAVAWDSDSDSIFWTDVESDTINRAHLNGSQQRVIVSSNLGKDLYMFPLSQFLAGFPHFVRKYSLPLWHQHAHMPVSSITFGLTDELFGEIWDELT
jgi:hypothetical protein